MKNITFYMVLAYLWFVFGLWDLSRLLLEENTAVTPGLVLAEFALFEIFNLRDKLSKRGIVQ